MLSLIVASWACRVSPTVCNRVIESARSLLNQCLPDIYIYSDHQKDKAAGLLVICKFCLHCSELLITEFIICNLIHLLMFN
jgi:RNA 3'-terminal phosphate cyclase